MTESILVVDEFDIDSMRIPVKVSAGKQAAKEHQRITNKLALVGYAPFTQPELEQYLESEGIDIYPLKSVQKFMDEKVSKIPSKTVTKVITGHYRRRRIRRTVTTKIKWRWLPIQDAVQTMPVEVLMRCEKISDDLGARVDLMVTEVYESKTIKDTPLHVDPFLAITAPGLPMYVIERWDEPAFRR